MAPATGNQHRCSCACVVRGRPEAANRSPTMLCGIAARCAISLFPQKPLDILDIIGVSQSSRTQPELGRTAPGLGRTQPLGDRGSVLAIREQGEAARGSSGGAGGGGAPSSAGGAQDRAASDSTLRFAVTLASTSTNSRAKVAPISTIAR